MSSRWNVFQGDHHLGLMTAQEIRRALREGRVDPFDMVSAEGSEIRTELVEVDEIFQEYTQPNLELPGITEVASTPSPKVPPQDISTPPPEVSPQDTSAPPQEVLSPAKNKKADRPAKAAFPPESTASRSAMAFPAESTRTGRHANKDGATNATHLPKRIRSQTVSDKRKDKKFLLIDDKNRVLGPLTAGEVQSLFYRGILSRHVKVQKVKTDRKIPIRQFISAYSGKRMKALADKGGKGLKGNRGHPSTRVLNELYHLINSKKLAETGGRLGPLLGLITLGVGLGLVVYLLFDWRQMQEDESQKQRPQRPALIQSDGNTRTAPAEASSPSPRTSPPRTASRPAQPSVEAPPSARPEPRRQASPSPAQRSARVETRAPATPSRRSEPTPAPRSPPSSEAAPASRPTLAPRSEPGPIAQAMATAGSVLSVGPVIFSQTELESCDLKCELTFRDAQGGQLRAVFFKGAYFDQLSGRGRGPVTLTGSSKLEDGKLILFIQDVR